MMEPTVKEGNPTSLHPDEALAPAAPAAEQATPGTEAPQEPPRQPTWWQHNRLALLLLLPLGALAALASSYSLFTLYRPNQFTRPHHARGPALHYQAPFPVLGFGGQKKWYTREATLTLKSLRATPTFQGEKAAPGATLWVVTLEFQARRESPLSACHVWLLDTGGRLYSDNAGKTGIPTGERDCVPAHAPGTTFDFQGNPVARPRPPVWTVQRTVALPQGRQPVAVRVAWEPPDYAQFPVR